MLLKSLNLLMVLSAVVLVPSCGHDQKLQSIALQPASGFVFEGFNARGQFTAIGTYIHPPETKDITNQVVWTLDVSNFADLTQTGQITYTRTDGCGSGDVTATYYSNPSDHGAGSAISASALVKGINDGGANCQP